LAGTLGLSPSVELEARTFYEAVGPAIDREKHIIVIENGPGRQIEDGGIGNGPSGHEWKGAGFVTVSKEFRT